MSASAAAVTTHLGEQKRTKEQEEAERYLSEQNFDSQDLLSSAVKDRYVRISEDALDEFFNYYLKELYDDPIPFGSTEKLHLAIEILGSSSGIYSYPPAWEFAKNKALWLRYCFAITNPISNVLFLMKATDDMLSTITLEVSIPPSLLGTLQRTSNNDLCIKYTKLLLGSIVCSVPFAVTTYLFPLPNCDDDACLGVTVGHSLITNMILHAISWSVILMPDLWYYRIPFLPFEKLFDYIRNTCRTEDEKRIVAFEEDKKIIFEKYQTILCTLFKQGVEEAVDLSIEQPNSEASKIAMEAIGGKNASLITFIELAHKRKAKEQPSNLSRCSPCHLFLLNKGIPASGAFFMLLGCAGWVTSPIYLSSKEGLNNTWSAVVGSIPAYSTAVLCAFYGSVVFKQIYQYLTSWPSHLKNKFTFETRCHPATFTMLVGLNLFLSWFAYATGQQLINTTFSDSYWDSFRSVLQQIEQPALQLLSFVPLLDLANTVMRRYQAKFGDPTIGREVSRLLVKAELIPKRFKQIPGPKLMADLNQRSPDMLKKMGIDPIKFKADLLAVNTQPNATPSNAIRSRKNTEPKKNIDPKPVIFSQNPAQNAQQNPKQKEEASASSKDEAHEKAGRKSWCERCSIQ